MMFFGKSREAEQAGTATPKRRSTLGILFNPDIGSSVRPLKETTSIFVNLIAMVFAANGLFPKDHPALQGVEGTKLSLGQVFTTAWNGLSFTKQGLPKVILFFAVTGTIVFAVLSVITALMAGFVGTAHADTGGTSNSYFSSAGADDLAQNWLDYIFKGIPLSHYYAQNGQPIAQSTGVQCALANALGFYSNAMLIFAAIILFYHLVAMVVSTAHEGVVMGKRANQIWAPIRLVVAIGLLVPVGSTSTACSTSGAGLNTGQYIVIQMASWGSGLASQTWKTFMGALAQPGSNFIRPNIPDVTDMVKNITLMEACKFAWNHRVCEADAAATNQDPVSACANPNNYSAQKLADEMIPTPTPSWTDSGNGALHIEYSPKNIIKNDNICGSIIIGAPDQVPTATTSSLVDSVMGTSSNTAAIAQSLQQAQKDTITGMLGSDGGQFAQVGAQIAQLIPQMNDGPVADNSTYWSLVNTYEANLVTNLSSALSSLGNLSNNNAVNVITSLGWAGAGAWLNTIARDQGVVIDAYQNGLPETQRPDLDELENVNALEQDWAGGVATELRGFATWANHKDPAKPVSTACGDQLIAAAGGGSATASTSTSGGSMGQSALNELGLGSGGNTGKVNYGDAEALMRSLIEKLSGRGLGDNESITSGVFRVINAQAIRSGVWGSVPGKCSNGSSPVFTLGAQLVTANPLQEFSFWGHSNLRAAFSLWDNIVKLSIASAVEQQEKEVTEFTLGRDTRARKDIVQSGLKSRIYDFVAGIFSLFATIFMMTGFTVAFVTPLVPFFRFFFNVLTWIVSTLEAVVAIPLVALAHLNPEGEGLPGQSARAAYFMIFNIFVRPVLTIFGLIAGLVVFYVAIMMLNMLFAIAVAGTNAVSHASYSTLVQIAFTVVYGTTVYVCANNAFKTIGFFPEHALRWIGAQAHHERMGDGGAAIRGALGQTQGVMGEKALGIIRLRS